MYSFHCKVLDSRANRPQKLEKKSENNHLLNTTVNTRLLGPEKIQPQLWSKDQNFRTETCSTLMRYKLEKHMVSTITILKSSLITTTNPPNRW